MRRAALFAVGLFASSVTTVGGLAVAADLSPPPVVPPAPISVAPDWTGFYLGIHGGYGWGHTSFAPAFTSTSPALLQVAPPNADPKGGLVGGQVGYNWQWGSIVGGLEVDFSAADIKQSSAFTFPDPLLSGLTFTQNAKMDELGTARGRVGYVLFPDVLVYGTAGLGLGHFQLDTTQTGGGVLVTSRSSSTDFGWVAGAGLEWKLQEHWLLRGEFLHYDFGSSNDLATPNFFFPGSTTPAFAAPLHTKNTLDVARAGLSYKF